MKKQYRIIGKNEDKDRYYDELERIVGAKEIKANKTVATFFAMLLPIYIIFWLLLYYNIFITDSMLRDAVMGTSIVIILLALGVCYLTGCEGPAVKYVLNLTLGISIMGVIVLAGFKIWLALAIPIVLSCRYYNRRFTLLTGASSCFYIVIGAYINAYVLPTFGYMDLNTVSFPQGATIDFIGFLYLPVVNAHPDPARTFFNTLLLSGIGNIIVMILLTIVCLFVITSTHDVMFDVIHMTEDESKMKVEIANNQAKMMLSQIQPHFLYNTLSAIMAIEGNPEETVDALGEFAKYLRENLNVITSGDLIPIRQEIKHVERYVSLEELRYGDRINVEFELEAMNFNVPALTVQLLVENAIKHGLFGHPEGGTVYIDTWEEADAFVLVVEDDGVGFVPELVPTDGKHVGLANLRTRLTSICSGRMNIESDLDKGTKVTIRIPKTLENQAKSYADSPFK